MSANKFEPGDRVIIAPKFKKFRGEVFTIKAFHTIENSRHVIAEYYSLNETKYTFPECDLIPYVESTSDENLISGLDLSSLFKGAYEI